jgi:hypothetical protein
MVKEDVQRLVDEIFDREFSLKSPTKVLEELVTKQGDFLRADDKKKDEIINGIRKDLVDCKSPLLSKQLDWGRIKGSTKGKLAHEIADTMRKISEMDLGSSEAKLKAKMILEKALKEYEKKIREELVRKILEG